jgi:hypothetical protein
MGTATLTPTKNHFGAGTIYMSGAGTTVPTLTVVGGKFTQAWTGWFAVGGTSAGLTVSRTPTFSDFVPAESYYATHVLGTGDSIEGSCVLNEISKVNLAFAFNMADANTLAGTGGNYTTSGTGANVITGFSAPLVGKEVRSMLGWQSENDDEVVFIYQGVNSVVSPHFDKNPNAQELSIGLKGELPATNPDTNNGYTSTQVVPWRWYLAGTAW